MNKLALTGGALLLGVLATALPAAAFAQTATVGISANVAGASTTVKAKGTASIATIQARADAEIQRRITNLQSLSTRVGQMKRLSSSQISTMQASITAEISTLQSLETKINADTVLATLKTDVQSITIDYRVYMLILPQDRIAAANDRVQTIVGLMQQLETKLSARISAAQAAGKNVTAAQSAYADFQTQVSNASAAATAAVNETTNLQPDQGNTTVAASNTAALKDAAAKIKTATADLKAARADLTIILNAVKDTGSVTASSTTNASVNQ